MIVLDRKPTITDVAKRAGVSMKTVSRVINKEPNVRDELRDRVLKAAGELGYQPNFSARSLAGVRSYQLAYLFGDPGGDYAHGVQIGILDACRDAGYHLVVEQIDVDAPDVGQRTATLIAQLRLDGVVLSPPITDHPEVLGALRKAGLPYVRIAPDDTTDASPSVRIDDAGAAEALTNYLIDLGHTEIGFIKGNPLHSAGRLRFDGFQRAMEARGLMIQPSLVEQGTFSYASGIDCAWRLLRRRSRPTAIFASNDDMAAAVVAVAHESGIDIPEDLSVVGFDDAPIAQVVWPPLTTVRQPIREMARAAADMLIHHAAGKDRDAWAEPVPHRQLAYGLRVRRSSGPPGERTAARARR